MIPGPGGRAKARGFCFFRVVVVVVVVVMVVVVVVVMMLVVVVVVVVGGGRGDREGGLEVHLELVGATKLGTDTNPA